MSIEGKEFVFVIKMADEHVECDQNNKKISSLLPPSQNAVHCSLTMTDIICDSETLQLILMIINCNRSSLFVLTITLNEIVTVIICDS